MCCISSLILFSFRLFCSHPASLFMLSSLLILLFSSSSLLILLFWSLIHFALPLMFSSCLLSCHLVSSLDFSSHFWSSPDFYCLILHSCLTCLLFSCLCPHPFSFFVFLPCLSLLFSRFLTSYLLSNFLLKLFPFSHLFSSVIFSSLLISHFLISSHVISSFSFFLSFSRLSFSYLFTFGSHLAISPVLSYFLVIISSYLYLMISFLTSFPHLLI